MQVVKFAGLYFAIVFGAGFVLGTFRVLVLLPVLGERWAELSEAPIMACVIILAARWLARRYSSYPTQVSWSGPLAAALVLSADFSVGVGLRGMEARQVILERDPVAGTVYYGLLVFFAALPAVFVRRALGRSRRFD